MKPQNIDLLHLQCPPQNLLNEPLFSYYSHANRQDDKSPLTIYSYPSHQYLPFQMIMMWLMGTSREWCQQMSRWGEFIQQWVSLHRGETQVCVSKLFSLVLINNNNLRERPLITWCCCGRPLQHLLNLWSGDGQEGMAGQVTWADRSDALRLCWTGQKRTRMTAETLTNPY